MSYILGSTGSLSRASRPKTHSWTRRRGSRATKRDRPSTPSANSRDDPACVVRPAEYPQVFPAATLDPGLQQAPATATDEVSRFDDHSLAAYLRAFQPPKSRPRRNSGGPPAPPCEHRSMPGRWGRQPRADPESRGASGGSGRCAHRLRWPADGKARNADPVRNLLGVVLDREVVPEGFIPRRESTLEE